MCHGRRFDLREVTRTGFSWTIIKMNIFGDTIFSALSRHSSAGRGLPVTYITILYNNKILLRDLSLQKWNFFLLSFYSLHHSFCNLQRNNAARFCCSYFHALRIYPPLHSPLSSGHRHCLHHHLSGLLFKLFCLSYC